MIRVLQSPWSGAALLACAVAFNAFFLAPELWVGQPAWNDSTFQLAAAERLGQSLGRGEPFLDPWVSEWSLGYPVWRTYQPLPHLVAAVLLRLAAPFVSHGTAFAILQYVLLTCLPLTAYASTRLIGLRPLACGFASLLILTPVGVGDFFRYGLGYAATVHSGSGLYTQLFAVHLLLLFLGVLVPALDSGRRRTGASLLLAATALSHIIFGYVAVVSAAVWAVIGPPAERPRRLVRLLTIIVPALLLLAWFVVPAMLTGAETNHSRWEPLFKWNSFGAEAILRALFSGSLLDGYRLPALTVMLGVGTLAALWYRHTPLARRLLALAGVWLVFFFGRTTWGQLLTLVGVPADFHLHRLQPAFELAAILLAAWGLERILYAARRRHALLAIVAVTIAGAVVYLDVDRATYLRQNARIATADHLAYTKARPQLEQALAAVRRILAERPGRVSAGRQATWGGHFRIRELRIYGFLTQAHMDQVSFLYHSMSLTSDIMELRNESDPAHDAAFGIRAVIAPAEFAPPAHWRLRGRFGRFAVYECSPEGYFGLVDIGTRYTGSVASMYDLSAAWLRSDWVRDGVVAAIGAPHLDVPTLGRWQALPTPPAPLLAPRGRIVTEAKDGETYRATVVLQRPCYASVKITWYPGLVATVDGQPAPVLRVTPDFVAIPVSAGRHTVALRYVPGPLKPILFGLGIVLFVGTVWLLRQPVAATAEQRAVAFVERWGQHLRTARWHAAVTLFLLILLSLHALARGQLISGHDATAYPPRLVEFSRVVADLQLPPVWAPDLGNGYGQPLFQFAPPLLYAVAYPLYVAGSGLTNALQFALIGLCSLGAIAMYRLGRRMPASRAAALGGAAAWLFAPYLALDLFVRAAFAEAAAIAVAPLALLGLVAALDKPSAWRIARGASLTALITLAHNAVALLMFPAFALVVATRRSWRAATAGLGVLVGGLGLSAFFWLPALAENHFVKTGVLREGFLHWSVHAIDPVQLLWSPWGYGLSVPGPNDGMSFALGPVHLALAVLGLAVVCRSAGQLRCRSAPAYAGAALVGAWLATSWSGLVWSHLRTLQYLTHPWRTLMLPATFLPLLIVCGIERLSPRTRRWAIAALVALNLAHTAPKGFLTFGKDYYAPDSIARRGLNTTTYEEYEPRWVVQRPAYTPHRLVGLDGRIDIITAAVHSARQEFTVRAQTDTAVEASTFYYPGWTVRIGKQEVPVTPVATRGTMSFQLSAGVHSIRLELHPTPLRRAARVLSVATALLLVVLSLSSVRYRRLRHVA